MWLKYHRTTKTLWWNQVTFQVVTFVSLSLSWRTVNFSKTVDIYPSTYIYLFEKNCSLLVKVADSQTVSGKSLQNYKFGSMPYLESETQFFYSPGWKQGWLSQSHWTELRPINILYFRLFDIWDENKTLEAMPFDIVSPLCITGSRKCKWKWLSWWNELLYSSLLRR